MKIKVLCWNIWCGTHLEEVIEFLKKADADIIGLQEVCEDTRGSIGEIIAKELGYHYVHAVNMDLPVRYIPGYGDDDMRKIKFGPAILSKHKIVKSQVIELTKEDNRLIIQADVEIGNQIVHVYSIHLKHTCQKYLELQDLQAENLINITSNEKTIVMGDFNSLPESIVVKKIKNALKDTEESIATPTWSVYKNGCTMCRVDSIRYKLDYIFTSKDLVANSFTVHDSKGSDHLPISAIIEI